MLRGNRSRSPPARRLVSANANTPRNNDSNNDGWVEVKWMPHSSLSNTSHVTLGVLSIHADNHHQHGSEPLEFTLRVEIGLISSQTTACTDGVWNEAVQLPIRWRDLPRDACCKIQVLQPNGQVKWKTSFDLFDPYGKMKMGLERLELFDPDASEPLTQEKGQDDDDDGDETTHARKILHELERLSTTPAFGEKQRVPWLDALTKEHCEQVLTLNEAKEDTEDSPHLWIEMPHYSMPILHEETLYYTNPSHSHFWDDEKEHDNPVEDKYRTLAHDLLRGLVDPALKPDREQRDRLAAIIASPSHHPTREEKDLLWRFRFSLVDNRRALTKFLLAVDWTVESEVVQAAELLEQWRKRSPIEVTDALKLLGKHVAFQTGLVRSYAIDTLAAAPDDELRLYLLQLVQAIKYENTATSDSSENTKSLANFLIERAANNVELANYLYWYLKVELQDPTYGSWYRDVFAALEARLSAVRADQGMDAAAESSGKTMGLRSIVGSVSKLGTSSSAKRAHHKSVWDVLTAQDKFVSEIMDLQMKSREARGKRDVKETHFRESLANHGFDRKLAGHPVPFPSAPHIRVDGVVSQATKMFKSALYPALVEFRVDSYQQQQQQQQDSSSSEFRRTDGATGSSSLSNKVPSYKVIVKTGDDLRQDQLVMMMIQLMDGLLKRGTLDLCLTTYSIIAMSPSSGLASFVENSMPISAVLAQNNNSVMNFFLAKAPQAGAKYGVKPEVMSNYVRSVAGSCVITYLLGVGDRHLDNVLLCEDGHFFHIDFGYMFGRDPKPLPPAFRLTREMVDGMGGIDSAEYRQFCSLACQAYNTLRKSAGLVLNLLHLMSDAGIEDLSNNPSADADGVISSVEHRFRLDLTDEQAERFFLGLIHDCLAAIAPRVMDVFHSIAVSRR